jgi:hypothetical protein
MFHHHKHVKHPKSGGRCDAEIAGDDNIGVILEKIDQR